MIQVPAEFAGQTWFGPEGAAWIDRLPRLVDDLADEWELDIEGPPWHGHTSLVVPVASRTGPAALKLTFEGDEESFHEGLALQRWAGNGTVQLLRADPRRRALLLERLRNETLLDLWDLEACEIVAGLYGRIHIPALPQLRTVTSYLQVWNASLAALPNSAPIPHRLVEQAVSLSSDFVDDTASIGTMIHGDLHYDNVLAADREPWLVIDPKPMSGDPHYEVAPMLWNRMNELAGDLREGIRRRFHAVIDAAGFEEERARDWVIVRAIHNACSTLDQAMSPADIDRDWITRMIAVAKAVQD